MDGLSTIAKEGSCGAIFFTRPYPTALSLDLEAPQSHAWECELSLAFEIASIWKELLWDHRPGARHISSKLSRLKAAQKLTTSYPYYPRASYRKSYRKATRKLPADGNATPENTPKTPTLVEPPVFFTLKLLMHFPTSSKTSFLLLKPFPLCLRTHSKEALKVVEPLVC